MRIRIIAPDGHSREVVLAMPSIRFGRDQQCEVPFDPILFPMVSGCHASIEIDAAGPMLTPRSKTNMTLLNGQRISAPTTVKVGDRIGLAATGPVIAIVDLISAVSTPASSRVTPKSVSKPTEPTPLSLPPGPLLSLPEPEEQPYVHDSTIQADSADLALLRGSATADQSFTITADPMLIGRDRGQAQIPLEHSHVSRFHARLTTNDGRVKLEDLYSANGTFVNGRRIVKSVVLKQGDRVDIGPFTLVYERGALVSRSRANNIELVARGVSRLVRDRAKGQSLALLDDINLVIRPKEFVCLLGPSGSGKTTLLTVLSGRGAPDAGAVLINKQDLYTHFEAIKREIAIVPQKDILHDTLSVGAALRYTAELRLPPDTCREEIDAAVLDILDVVSLSDRRETLIRHLSGGQLKRASLANELMARPSLLFLDEVTSGLDEQTDREMMHLFRRVADGGKTVVCITHNLANVEATCKLVVILTDGGRLAFVGSPDEAKSYFGIARLGDVYRRLSDQEPEEWQAQFEDSAQHARYVAARMPSERAGADAIPPEPPSGARPKSNPLTQASILIRRYLAIWRGDVPALLALLGQSLLVAILLGLVFGDLRGATDQQRSRNLLFLLTICSFWFGCNTAAKELVKERVIFKRERGFNLRVDSYLASKLAVLLLIGLAQVSLLYAIVHTWCAPVGAPFLQWLAFACLMIAGAALGLMLSALAKTEEMAAALVPIAIIPQIILAGVIAPLSGLSNGIAWIAITCFHGQGGVDSLLPESDRSLLRLADASIGERAFAVSLLVVFLHAVVFIGVAYYVLVRQTRASSKT